MQIFWIVSLAAAVVVAVFALQNSVPVDVKFLFWQVETSVPLLVFAAAAAGGLIMFFLGLPRQVRAWRELRNLKSERKALRAEQELMQRRIAESAPKEPPATEKS